MKATITKIDPSTDELVPCLHVYLEIEYNNANYSHLHVGGLMMSSDNKLLSEGNEIMDSDYKLASSNLEHISSCDIKVSNVTNADLTHFNTILKVSNGSEDIGTH